ncbi:hypothetical protein KEM55_003062, partial [Ascosphaera atra]
LNVESVDVLPGGHVVENFVQNDIAACVTPTDPVLSGAIVKGKYADEHVPKDLQQLIVAESGANDGLGYPFLFLAVYLIQYTGMGGAGQDGTAQKAIGLWFGDTWGYTILLSVVYGAVVGYGAKVLLRYAESHNYVDRESFLISAVTLALFTMGTCGMIGSDDVLACFVAGNAFTIDDWFRLETLSDSVQPTLDMLLNLTIFMWLGAVCPWYKFAHNDIIPIYRLIFLGILVLLVRRIPVTFALYRFIPQIKGKRQAAFVGFFGPIGISAIFYLYLAREYIDTNITVDGHVREDAQKLSDTMEIVVWFVILCSVIVHGLSVPVSKLIGKLYRMTRKDEHPTYPFPVDGTTFATSEPNLNLNGSPPTPPRPAASIELTSLPRNGRQVNSELGSSTTLDGGVGGGGVREEVRSRYEGHSGADSPV